MHFSPVWGKRQKNLMQDRTIDQFQIFQNKLLGRAYLQPV